MSQKTTKATANEELQKQATRGVAEFQLKEFENTLKQWAKNKKVPQSLLVTGSEGSGKRELAQSISKALLCENTDYKENAQESLFGAPSASSESGETRTIACGSCPSCLRFDSENAFDFFEIYPEEEASGRSGKIKVDQIRVVTEQLGRGSHEGKFKIFLIASAHLMTDQAANALLKVLEEPPEDWVFILTGIDQSLLIPTIVSRCQRIRLKPLPHEVVEKVLESFGAAADRRQVCTHLSEGNFRKALLLSQDPHWDGRTKIFDFIESPGHHLNELTDWIAQSTERLSYSIDQFESVAYDLIVMKEKISPHLKNSDKQTLFRKLAEKTSHSVLQRRVLALQSARSRIEAPLNKKLLAQNVLGPWLET